MPKFQRVALRNLGVVYPQMLLAERESILSRLCFGVARMLVEFAHFPEYNKDNIAEFCVHDGLENYLQAQQRGKGVLVLTGHIGGWEVGSFAHAIYGHPMHIVVRDIDNPLIDRLARQYRERFGNVTIDGRRYARTFLRILRSGGTVGVLADTNVTPPRGIFVPFFGVMACTGTAIAKLAWHTDAAVVPGYTIWDGTLLKYRIVFQPALKLQKSDNEEADIIANTAMYNRVLEGTIREYPEQWLWVHRRWKQRPAGEDPIY